MRRSKKNEKKNLMIIMDQNKIIYLQHTFAGHDDALLPWLLCVCVCTQNFFSFQPLCCLYHYEARREPAAESVGSARGKYEEINCEKSMSGQCARWLGGMARAGGQCGVK